LGLGAVKLDSMGIDPTGDESPAGPPGRSLRVVMSVAVGLILVGTAAAAVALWPPPVHSKLSASGSAGVAYSDATVTSVEAKPCGPFSCEAVAVHLDSGLDAGTTQKLLDLTRSASTPVLQVGDKIVVAGDFDLQEDRFTYSYADAQRRQPMVLLALIFAVIVVGVAQWRGFAALVGLVITWLVLVKFLIPAILNGESPIAVALTASTLIMFVVLYLAHGVNARTTTALFGTLASLALTGIFAVVFVDLTRLTGLTSDAATYIANTDSTVNISGLLLCGIIIGSLGVLNDVTVTQAAAVWEIHAADPRASAAQLYRAGMRIGRDHIASTVYTLVLAYAGASLPLLILFSTARQSFADIVTGDIVAEEVVRTLVGSVGLVAAVPFTTLIAAIIVTRGPAPDPVVVAGPGAVGIRARELVGTAAGAPARAAGAAGDRGRDALRTRRDRRHERQAAKDKAWRPPAAEREFWDS
jgi:uncharacterized membrane protein